MRVIQGLPSSWGQIVATSYHHDSVEEAAWSPCGRFIAATRSSGMVEILDAVTLEPLNTLECSLQGHHSPSFSQDGSLLTVFSSQQELTSWDLQTGGPIGNISGPDRAHAQYFSSTHSTDGKMVAVAYGNPRNAATTPIISTYNLLSKTHIYSYCATGYIVAPIWTHGECLRFVTLKPGSITIWEAKFTSIHTLAEVVSLPAPSTIDWLGETSFLPTLSRLAYTLDEAVLVWDAQDSKLLLDFPTSSMQKRMSFSSNGHFFICETTKSGVYLWKESPTGYILHQKLVSPTNDFTHPLLSPSGESIIVVRHSTIQLRYTRDPITSLSSAPTQSAEQVNSNFILEFSPDRTLGVVARLWENTAMVLNLKSGNPWFTIDTGMKILGLKVTGSHVIAVGERKVITWNLPVEGCTLNGSPSIDDGVQTTIPNNLPLCYWKWTLCASISPDSNQIALLERDGGGHTNLKLYNISTGKHLTYYKTHWYRLWFAPDGHEFWCIGAEGAVGGWAIIKDNKSGHAELEPLEPTVHPSGEPPWQSSYGYTVTDNCWVHSPNNKRLLWLPHHWRPGGRHMTWSGRFLGLLGHELPEAVILELDE